MEGGSGSADITTAGAAVSTERGGAATEFEIAATVEGCDESIDVAISSSLEVAASSLQYIMVSLDLGAAICLSIASNFYAKEQEVTRLSGKKGSHTA